MPAGSMSTEKIAAGFSPSITAPAARTNVQAKPWQTLLSRESQPTRLPESALTDMAPVPHIRASVSRRPGTARVRLVQNASPA
jgi:hypothetical protein